MPELPEQSLTQLLMLQKVAAARLMGATVIVTGLSADVAQSLVALGIDLAELETIGALQGGLEESEPEEGLDPIARGRSLELGN